MPLSPEGWHTLDWFVSFSSCNVDLGRHVLGLSHARVELQLSGMRCMSMCHKSASTQTSYKEARSHASSQEDKMSVGAKHQKLSASAATKSAEETKDSLAFGAEQRIRADYVKQETNGPQASWSFLPHQLAANVHDAVAVLNYREGLYVHLKLDSANHIAAGVLSLRPAVQDLVLIDRSTGKLVDPYRRWIVAALLGQRDLVRLYGGQARLHEMRLEFSVSRSAEDGSRPSRAIPLRGD